MGNLEGGGGAPLLGTPEGVYRKGLEIGLFLYSGPAGGPGRGLIYFGC